MSFGKDNENKKGPENKANDKNTIIIRCAVQKKCRICSVQRKLFHRQSPLKIFVQDSITMAVLSSDLVFTAKFSSAAYFDHLTFVAFRSIWSGWLLLPLYI